jgi:hypothetical protein
VHYRRWLRTGDPLKVDRIFGDTEARFWSKVEKTPGCWIWTGALTEEGYGLLGIGGTKNRLAHRWSYERFVGPIPEGLQLDHLCRVRNCVNPEHLEPVTAGENARRSPLTCVNKTHCPHGHAYDETNTQWVLVRMCRACKSGRMAVIARRKRRDRKRKT